MRRSFAAATKPPETKPVSPKIQWARLAGLFKGRSSVRAEAGVAINPFKLPTHLHPPGVVPEKKSNLAMDEACFAGDWAYAGLSQSFGFGLTHFVGYPELALHAQRPEFRKITETIATEMTRRWIKISSTNDGKGEDDDKSEKIAQLSDAMDRLHVRDVFREGATHDGFFGRGHIFIDLGAEGDELNTPIGNGRNSASKAKIGKGSLRALRAVEPVWVYPTGYNATDPLKGDWYKPQSWLVQGRPVHASRLLTLIGREVPDLLKPAYSFGGLSMSQMAKPYVDNWLRTRQSVSDLIHSFSTSGLKTDLATTTMGDGSELFARAEFYNQARDNHGLMLLNKDTEDFFNVSTPLGTLDHLQAQAQEQMSSIASIPLVKLLGITPSGLNASSDGEVRCFYDWIRAYQEHLFAKPLDVIFAMVQLSEFGEVDPDLTYSFEPLWELNEKERAEVDEIRARTAQTHIDAGVISPMEERERVAADPDSPYTALDIDDMPEAPLEPEGEGGVSPAAGSGQYAPQAHDANFNEEDHPRGEGGKFSGSVHVVSTNDPDNDRTRIHGVFADEGAAKKAHAAELHKAYSKFRVANYGGPVNPHTPSWVAEQTLQDHGRAVPTLQSVHVGGESAPSEVSLVHETALHDGGHTEARMHGASTDHAEALGDADKAAEAFWGEHPSYDDDDNPEAFPGLRRANAFQRDQENMGWGQSRTGVFNVTRHPVIQ